MVLRLTMIPVMAVIAASCLSGCGSPPAKPEGATGTPTAKEALLNLVDLLNHFDAAKKKPPARIADVEPLDPVFPAAYLGLVRKEVIYVWGTPLDPAGGGTVMAYEQKAEDSGGWVLMQDGTLKEMTAADFKAAPKAPSTVAPKK